MNTKLKKALYESIMKSVAKTVKKALNESVMSDSEIREFCEIVKQFLYDDYATYDRMGFCNNWDTLKNNSWFSDYKFLDMDDVMEIVGNEDYIGDEWFEPMDEIEDEY